MLGGDSGNVLAVRPLREGTMTEFDVTQRMLAVVLRRVGVTRFPKPGVLVCVPPLSTNVERRAIERAIRYAGGRQVVPVEEPLAAAVGANLGPRAAREPDRRHRRRADRDGRRLDGGVVSGRSASVGGFDLDAAIQEHIRSTYGVSIREKSAEELKVAIGSAFPSPTGRAAKVIGRELATGNTVEVKVDEDEIRQAMAPAVKTIVDEARITLAEAPPELTHDVLETGMFLTGGGSLLRGLDMLLAQECEVPVHVVEHPLETVVSGAGRMLEHLDDYRTSFQLLRRG